MGNISRGLTGAQHALCSQMAVNYVKAQKELGKKIRVLRLKDGLSQEELAYRADIERSYMGKIERGEGNPSFKKLVDIANALKTQPEELIS